MTLYDTFAILAVIGGIYSGTFFLIRAWKYRKMNKMLFAMIAMYALFVCYYLAVIYALQLVGVLPTPILTLGAYTRPAIGLGLWLPSIIVGWVEYLQRRGIRL
jgi:hypothetical protein